MLNEKTTNKMFQLNLDKERKFSPSVEWMKKTFIEMNALFFDNKLQMVHFELTSPREKCYGNFQCCYQDNGNPYGVVFNNMFRCFRYKKDGTFVNVDNQSFYKVCYPVIRLNPKYLCTEYSWVATMVHEMCHLYNNHNGKRPRLHHGKEFKAITAYVNAKSGGYFNLDTYIDNESRSQSELCSSAKEKADAKKKVFIQKASAVILRFSNGYIGINLSTLPRIHNCFKGQMKCKFINGYGAVIDSISTTNDPDFLEFCTSNGYGRNFRTLKYYRIEGNSKMLDYINNHKEIFHEEKRIADKVVVTSNALAK